MKAVHGSVSDRSVEDLKPDSLKIITGNQPHQL